MPKHLRKGRNTRDQRNIRDLDNDFRDWLADFRALPDPEREQAHINNLIRLGGWDQLATGNTMPWRAS